MPKSPRMQEVKTTHRVWHTCCLCKAHNARLRYTCRYFGARAGHLASQLRAVLEILPRAKRGIENQPALRWETVKNWQSCGEVFRLRFKIHFPVKFPSRENWNSSTLESTWTHQSIISTFKYTVHDMVPGIINRGRKSSLTFRRALCSFRPLKGDIFVSERITLGGGCFNPPGVRFNLGDEPL